MNKIILVATVENRIKENIRDYIANESTEIKEEIYSLEE